MLDEGKRLGPYEILSPLGAGGMGEVYRARDTRLGREVAVKVLPDHLTANPEIRTRFEREARTISGLNHPNICTLFDVGREDDTDYLVMELVEGETLAERLRKGPLPTPELVRYGAQVADALDRAHRAGVIHRDLKPANVMITRSGAKLMDFGLARASGMSRSGSGSGSMSGMSQSPTVAQALTSEGSLIGTFQYMAPEQLEGGEADARSDIWTLGCVLYEMATGRRAFEGRSQASLIAAILEREPAMVGESLSGASTPGSGPPQGLDRLIRACLTKDPEERLQTAHDAKLQLQWIAESAGLSSVGVANSTPGAVPAPVIRKQTDSRLAWAVAAVATLVAVAAIAWLYPRANAPRPGYRFRTEPVQDVADYLWPRLSPDGRMLVFDATDSTGLTRAWLRPMDQTLARPIVGSEGLRRAYWSPNGKEIAFVANGKIQRLPITGGSPVTVCEAQGGVDLSWGSKGQILMDGRTTDSLRIVPAAGGELRPATRIDRAAGEMGSAWPHFLPDGEHFLFIGNVASSGLAGGTIRLGKLGSLESKVLGRSDGRVEYAPGGWVLFLKGTTLLAQKLDLGAGKLTGQPLTIAERLRTGASAGHFSISAAGVLAYSRGGVEAQNMLFEADRSGKTTGSALVSGQVNNPRLSPDGQRLLFEMAAGGQADGSEIWVRDLVRGTQTKLVFGAGSARMPLWSPDGRRFACVQVPPTGPSRILIGSADGLGGRDSVSATDALPPMLTDWTKATGQLLVIPGNFQSLQAAKADSGDKTLRPFPGVAAGFIAQAVLSPDGRWLAYASTDGGTSPQVFVISLSGTPGRWQISTRGGYMPVWTRGGRELVFEGEGGVLAVDIETSSGFHAGTPTKLFTLPVTALSPTDRSWGCSEDGQRFFLLVAPRQVVSGDIEVVTDFGSMVNRK